MRNLSKKSRLIGIAVAVLALGVVGLVYAAWTANGNGQGYAKAGSAQALTTVDVSASSTATLYPGSDGNVLIKVSNPNSYPVKVTSVNGNGTITADATHASAGCTNANTGVTYTDQSTNIDVPANGATQTTLSNAAHMSNASDNGCQGATFTIPVTLSGASNAS
jgi:cytoskeletal protein RodZ